MLKMHGIDKGLFFIFMIFSLSCSRTGNMNTNIRTEMPDNLIRQHIVSNHGDEFNTSIQDLKAFFSGSIDANDLPGIGNIEDKWADLYFSETLPKYTFEITFICVYDDKTIVQEFNKNSKISLACRSGYIPFGQNPANGGTFFVSARSGRVFLINLGSISPDGLYANYPDGRGGNFVTTQTVDDKLMNECAHSSWDSIKEFWASSRNEIINAL